MLSRTLVTAISGKHRVATYRSTWANDNTWCERLPKSGRQASTGVGRAGCTTRAHQSLLPAKLLTTG